MDDPKVAEKVRLIVLRDEWLIARGKPTPKTKARMKKAAKAEKQEAEKKSKTREKAKKKGQAMNIRRLAIINSRKVVGAFKEILSDPPTGPKTLNTVPDLPGPVVSNNAIPNIPGPEPTISPPNGLLGTNARLSNSQKKKTTQQTLVGRLKSKALLSKQAQTLTPLPAAIELIRPGKRKIRVTANAVENTLIKQMCWQTIK